MKTLKLVGMALLAILMSFSLAACSDDDDEEDSGSTTASIVGEWEQTWQKGYEHCPNDPSLNEDWDAPMHVYHIFFYKGGKGKEIVDDGEIKTESTFDWTLAGKSLTLTLEEDGMVFEAKVKVVELTESTLKLEQKGEEDGCQVYTLDTFKRVKQ